MRISTTLVLSLVAVTACGDDAMTSPDGPVAEPDAGADAGPPAEPELIVEGIDEGLFHADVDATHVYWSVNDAVWRHAKDGTGASELFVTCPGGSCVHIFADDDGYLYGSGGLDGSVYRVDKELGSPSLENYFEADNVEAIATDTTNIYWSEGPFGPVRTLPKGDGPVTDLDMSTATAIIVDDTHVYWVTSGERLFAAAKDGAGDAVELGLADRSFHLAVDAENLYYAAMSGVAYVPKGGGAVTTIGAGPARAVIADDEAVYWAAGAQGILRWTGGGPAEVFAATPSELVTMDESYVYALGGGQIWRIAR